jgi:flavin reductase (DIM6/NTAB) family NADH-FMN oxidoreductase RutF
MPAPPQRFRDVMGRFPTGVAVVACAGPDGPAGLTTSAVTSVSLDPALLLVCLDNASRTLPELQAAGRFSVSVLREGQDDLALRLASKADMAEKWLGVDHHDEDGVPVLSGALAWIACDVHDVVPAGDHAIVIGAVSACGLDAGGGRPLVHHRGEFAGLHFGI